MPGLFEERQQKMVAIFCECLEKPFIRGDYKELVELSLLIVSKGSEPVDFTMAYPGAFHKARWMSKLLYCLKIVLLSTQIQAHFPKSEILTTNQVKILERFAIFTIAAYVPWWIVCNLPANAPINDIKLVDTLADFAPYDNVMVKKAREALGMHTWYLAEELVPLALFSSELQENMKKDMRKALLANENVVATKRVGLQHGGYGKPYLPSVPEKGTALADLIGPDSWRFFTILGMPHQFLHSPVSEWANPEDYINIKQVVDNLQVVNEVAKRGVKLCHDFITVVRKEILQVIEND